MSEIGDIKIKMRVDLFSELVSKLSYEGLSDLEAAIVGERYRREELKKFPELKDLV